VVGGGLGCVIGGLGGVLGACGCRRVGVGRRVGLEMRVVVGGGRWRCG